MPLSLKRLFKAKALAFVCNEKDNTVSIVDLVTHAVVGTMTTTQGFGLGPTDIAINASPFTGVIANPGDSTVTLLDVAGVLTELGIP